jgi:hypothetical protein
MSKNKRGKFVPEFKQHSLKTYGIVEVKEETGPVNEMDMLKQNVLHM